MQIMGDISAPSAGDVIRERLYALGINQMELAARVGEHFQTISAIINGKREANISLSVRIDEALGLSPGTIALAQTRYQVEKEINERKTESIKEKRHIILEKIKANGGFWSYQGIPDSLDDDSVIEAALVHLDLEDMPLLLGIWSKAHIKRVWKERLVSQGKRMNILNYILAVKLFGIPNPDNYISRYELKIKFPDAREEILGENPVQSMTVGLKFNNLKTPNLQELLGMKVYTLCVRTTFRDYYDIYCLLEDGCKLEEAISYASYLSRHEIRSKTMYSRLLSPQLFQKGHDFEMMLPKFNVSAEDIRDRIKVAIEAENLKNKSKLFPSHNTTKS